uniref:Centrosomal protein of 70 kDa n=1 Tax=Neogobius melanostomus TaxID=47308 RepID=A0A8C6S6K1_9GOBI
MDQQEQVEWGDVNKLLQHHGFRPVLFADPVENKALSELVLLDKRTAADVRATLKVMLTDSERRQQLIQELIRTNNQLKEDVQSHMRRSVAQTQRASELETLLEGVRVRVQELEERCVGRAAQTHGEMQQLQHDKRQAQKLVQDLEQALMKQKEEVSQLQKKLHFAVREEEQRVVRQSQAFEQICRRTARQSSAHDQQVLDVIDHYETKMSQLLDELRRTKGEEEMVLDHTSRSISPTFKTLIKAFQEQQKDGEAQAEELRKKVEHLRLELETRPTLKDLKFYKHKVRRIEKLYNLRLSQDENSFEICDNSSESTCAQHQQLLSEISSVVTGPNAPLRLHRQKPRSDTLKMNQYQPLVPTLELWAQQLRLLKDLQQSLNNLSARLLPWQPSEECPTSAEPAKVEDMMLLVDTLLENTSTHDEKVLRSPTRHTLGSMVAHFQKLFDVSSLSGVYPRMNEVYCRLGEMNNAMRNIRDALSLDSRVTTAEVVNIVSRMAASSQPQSALHDLLGEGDIDSIIQKVKEHDEFSRPFIHSSLTSCRH